jgi:hypothetical protein
MDFRADGHGHSLVASKVLLVCIGRMTEKSYRYLRNGREHADRMRERGWLESVSNSVHEKEEKSVDFVKASMEPKHARYSLLERRKKEQRRKKPASDLRGGPSSVVAGYEA